MKKIEEIYICERYTQQRKKKIKKRRELKKNVYGQTHVTIIW